MRRLIDEHVIDATRTSNFVVLLNTFYALVAAF